MSKFLGKKRNRKAISKSSKKNEKNKKAKNKNQSSGPTNLPEIKFIAKINKNIKREEEKHEESKNANDAIIQGDMLIFHKRKHMAKEKLKTLKVDLAKKTHEEIVKEVEECINLDNTNKAIIYECLKILWSLEDKKEFNNLLENSKFCLTKKFKIIDENNPNNISEIDLSDFSPIDKTISFFNDDNEIIQELTSCFKKLGKIYDLYKEIKNTKKMKNLIKILLTFNLGIKEDSSYYVIEKKSKKEELNILYNSIFEFLKNYIYIKKMEYYKPNQPINIKNNKTLYLFHIFFKFFENVVNVNYKIKKKKRKKKKGLSITLSSKKLDIFGSINKFINDIINDLEKNSGNNYDEIEKKIRFFFFCLKAEPSPAMLNNLQENIDKVAIQQKQLTKETIEKFLDNHPELKPYFSFENNIMNFEYNKKKYKFNYKVYNEKILGAINSSKDEEFLLKKLAFNPDYFYSFYDDNDIKYIKTIIKKILKSRVFHEIWENYSEATEITDYYFNNDYNIEELLNSIEFYPYDESDFGLQGITFYNELKIVVSSLPINNIKNETDFYIYKILEMARKIMIILHEVSHFIKRSLSLITGGDILNTTIENINEDADKNEAGRLFEYVLFDIGNHFEKKEKNDKQIPIFNENNKELNLDKALKILNPEFYENNIEDFRKKFNNGKKVKKSKIPKELMDYLVLSGFNFDNYCQNSDDYKDYTIDIAKRAKNVYNIKYKSDYHNYKH